MKFVSLTDHLRTGKEKASIDKLSSKSLNPNTNSYKLENTAGLIWCATERDDEFYSEWEKVQPAKTKYAIYYEPSKTSHIVKPKELFAIKNKLNGKNNFKDIILEYVKSQNLGKKINHVICEVDRAEDIADLHTLFDTPEVSKVVQGYAQAFSGMYWNYIDEKDESFFQVPSLMLMDSECMDITKTIETVPYQQRKNGANKFTGEPTKEINIEEVLATLNSKLDLDKAVELLKLKRDIKNPSVIAAIETKLSGYRDLENAKKIMINDELANEIYIISGGEARENAMQEILENTQLQNRLRADRLNGTGRMDVYMAMYVEMIETTDREKFFKAPARDTLKEAPAHTEITTEDIGKIPRVKETKVTPIKQWLKNAIDKFRGNKKEEVK